MRRDASDLASEIDPAHRPSPSRAEGEWFDCEHCGKRVTSSMYDESRGGELVPAPPGEYRLRHAVGDLCMRQRVFTRRARDGWVPLHPMVHPFAERRWLHVEREGARPGQREETTIRWVRADDAESLLDAFQAGSPNRPRIRLALDVAQRVREESVPWWVAIRLAAQAKGVVPQRYNKASDDFAPDWWWA